MPRWNPAFVRHLTSVSTILAGLGGLAPLARAQAERPVDAASRRHAVTGRVLRPDGVPAAGAVVVASAGGQVVADEEGRFVLEYELPLDAETVEVTAVLDDAGRGTLAANARFVPSVPAPEGSVGVLGLTLSQDCHPRWLPTFGAEPGTNGSVLSAVVFDDGSGPALHVGGHFTSAGGLLVNRIAKWDGSRWSALGSGLNSSVRALAVYDDGSGPALYAGGDFTAAGGVEVLYIARWDGASWSAVGGGIAPLASVRALAVYDDGSGPALYVGGSFTVAGGVPANLVAKWDGTSWSALGSGMNSTSTVNALAVYDDGSGPALHAGGDFSFAGGVKAVRVAKWDGSSWSDVGDGVGGGSTTSVFALAVYDDGSGSALYAGGTFTTAGPGLPANRIAKWNGSSWSALGAGVTHPISIPSVQALTVHDDGSGPALHVGGLFTSAGGAPVSYIAKWDGASWSGLAGGLSERVHALTTYDDGSGPELFAGGLFTSADGTDAVYVARWDGSVWDALGGQSWVDGPVGALQVHDDGSGPALYAGGHFTTLGGVPANRIARWDGSSWSALGSGIDSPWLVPIHALAVYDDGGGPALYAGGAFASAGGVAAKNIARWDGTSWSALGSGANGSVQALAVYDDGGGPALYAAGALSSAGGVAANRIARWDGSSWSPLGSGVNNVVEALAVYDDGGGPALYAGGSFTSPGSRIARWDGSAWSALGSGMGGFGPSVTALAVHDDGGGPALYAGGSFTSAGGVNVGHVARWDGTSWSALGEGLSAGVYSLIVHDSGSGPCLYAGGGFGRRVAKWDGASWTTIGSGFGPAVQALASWDDGGGPALYAGGEFTASPASDCHLAKWGCRAKPTVKQRRL